MSNTAELSDFEDDLLPNGNANDSNAADGYGSDEAIEDTNFRDDDESGESKARRVDPKTSQKRPVKNPQPRLNAERLKGPKGIQTIEQYFEDFKFRGKGYEKRDLDRLMKKLEYWSHRLFPKLEFDDCLSKLETLGSKKPVQTHLTKIRLGLLTNDDVVMNDDEADNEEVVEDSVPIDEFDALIAEELEKKRYSVTPQRQNTPFLPTASNTTPSRITDVAPNVSSQSSSIEITDEMRERMERNRQIAIQKRLARIEAEEAKKRALLEQGNENGESTDQGQNQETPTAGNIA